MQSPTSSNCDDQDTLFKCSVMVDAAVATLFLVENKKMCFFVGKNLHFKHSSLECEMGNILNQFSVNLVVTLVTRFTGEVKGFHLACVLADQCASSPGSSL